MKLVNQSDNVDQVSEQAINEGVFLRTPVPWITEWQTLMDQAWTYLIEDGHGTNYTNIYNELSSMNHSLYEYLLSNYNSTVAQEYEKGEFQPLLV
ncbi:hypothetical protein [Thermogymnomonas acidicola]|nr:hypothetical protein [Thermogymnomonas acidicola]